MTDWDSKHYKEHARAQASGADEILNSFSFRGDETVLDIGCGNGSTTRNILNRVPQGKVVGMDASKSMIDQAIADFGTIPNLSFFQKSAEAFTFFEKFDLVTSFFALHWVKDHAAVLRNVKAVLKEKGKILFMMVSGGDIRIGEVFQREPWKTLIGDSLERFRTITADDYDQLLDRFGFKKNRVETIELTHTFANSSELKEHFMTWLPAATSLQYDQCQKFASEIAENICQHQKTRENIDLTTSMLLVEAENRA